MIPTGSYLAPFITTIGLYDGNELVAVGKLGRPVKNLVDWPVNIVVRFDIYIIFIINNRRNLYMPALEPIATPSGQEKLETLYRTIHTDARLGASAYGNIRSHLIAPRNNIGDRGWGESAKAGSPFYQSTRTYIDNQYTRTFQPNSFIPFITRNGGFNNSALNYARNTLRHSNTAYYG
jgi:hypothetical protein